MSVFVHARYPNQARADAAVKTLLEAHATPDDVRVMVRDGDRLEQRGVSYDLRVGRSAFFGGLVGAILGAIIGAAGWLPIFSSDSGTAALQAAVAGLFLGAFAGAVRGRGWWDRGADVATHEPDTAGVVVGVSTSPARAEELKRALARTGGTDVGITDQIPEREAEQELHVGDQNHP